MLDVSKKKNEITLGYKGFFFFAQHSSGSFENAGLIKELLY